MAQDSIASLDESRAMVGTTTEDLADVLATRRRFLDALATEPASKRALEERLDVSRSTVDRAVRDLETWSLVTYADREYHLTPAGRYGRHVHVETADRLDALVDASDVLSALPPETPLDADLLAGGEVVRGTPRNPDGVVSRLLESIESADVVEGVAPVALTGHVDAFYESSTAGGASVRMLVEAELFDYLANAADDPLGAGAADPDVRLERAPSVPFEFGLWLADDREAGVVVYTETGVKAIVVNDAPAAVSWAREQFERVAETATPAAETGTFGGR
jgi:predicted transcriptional regulator